MAKKLAKAQIGLFLKKAIKTASKIEAPVFKNKKIINEIIPKATEARSVNSLIKGKESMVNANNPYKTIKKPRLMTKTEIQQKQIDDSYKQKGGSIKTKKK